MKVLRELREGELTIKDMSVLRENPSARQQHKRDSGTLTEYSLNHVVSLSYPHTYDRALLPFNLHIDDKKYRLSWAELMDMDRGGFFRREEGNPSTYRLLWLDGPKIEISTDLNEEAQRDMIIRLTTDEAECYLDWYQWLMIGRFI